MFVIALVAVIPAVALVDVPVLGADIRKLRQETGWTPSFNLEEGLRHTIAWWRDHLDEEI